MRHYLQSRLQVDCHYSGYKLVHHGVVSGFQGKDGGISCGRVYVSPRRQERGEKGSADDLFKGTQRSCLFSLLIILRPSI